MTQTDPCAFRKAVEAHDLEALMATFADDAVLNSPVSFEPFRGKPMIRQVKRIPVFQTGVLDYGRFF